MTAARVVEADLTWTGERFADRVQVAIGRNGRISAVGALGRAPDLRLRGRALLPGLVDAHSHAFQRGLRGHGERFPGGVGSFWTWRAAMYDLVERLDGEQFRRLCLRTFRELLRSGTTTVGEFHYLHHTRDSADWALDRLILEAAREAGIRLVLVQTYYRTGGIGRALEPPQRRFDGGSLAAFWEQVDRLLGELDPATQRLAVAAHSIRAVDLEEIVTLREEAVRRGFVLHLHLEEQRAEVEDCLAFYGLRPMALLGEVLESTRDVVAVHCTHTLPGDLERFLARGGRVCLCPLTEANLGDGLPDLAPAATYTDRLSLGTDSNARIAMLEEMRWLEYGQRLRHERRGILRQEHGEVGRTLLEIATQGGARALGLEAGRIAPGQLADLVAIDVSAPELADTGAEGLLDALVFGGGGDLVREVCVGGRWSTREDLDAGLGAGS